jgi:hypothetical protein
MHILPSHWVEMILERAKQAQILTIEQAGWAREAVLKLQMKENSLSPSRNQQATHFATTLA